jgi:nicotinamidase-related amidase
VSDRHTDPDFGAVALITIDTQRDVLDGAPLQIDGTSQALGAMSLLAREFRRSALPIVHIVRIYEPDGSNAEPCRRKLIEQGASILATGAPGTEIARELLADPGATLDSRLLLAGGMQRLGPREVALYKPRWGAFYGTALEEHLRELSVTTLVFCGANFPNCPRTSIYEASERDFRIVVARDGVSGLYERGEQELSNIGVHLLAAAEIVQALASSGVSVASRA